MKVIIFLVLINILWAKPICSKKQFLLNLLNSNAIWSAAQTNSDEKYYPIDFLRIEEGMVSIKTDESDYHPVLLNIRIDDVGVVGVFMYGDLPYGVDHAKVYENKDFIFTPYEDSCILDKIKLEIKIADTYNGKKEIIVFQKYKVIK